MELPNILSLKRGGLSNGSRPFKKSVLTEDGGGVIYIAARWGFMRMGRRGIISHPLHLHGVFLFIYFYIHREDFFCG